MARLAARLAPLLASLALATSSACSLRPQPEPPPAEPEIDRDLLSATPSSPAAAVGGSVQGSAGAAPPGALLRAYNLDNVLPPSETYAEDDGSFLLHVDMNEGDELRLQVIAAQKRGTPLDVIVGEAGATPQPASRALGSCLSVLPAAQLDLGSPEPGSTLQETVEIANRCGFDVTLGAARMRRPVDGLSVTLDAPAPIVVPGGEGVAIDVAYDASVEPPFSEGILLLEFTAPEPDRRPITIFTRERN